MYCRWRRRFYGKYENPPYWIDYLPPWTVQVLRATDRQGNFLWYKTLWKAVRIDPRGHFTMLRCAAIITLHKIITRWRWTARPLAEFGELLSCYPTW